MHNRAMVGEPESAHFAGYGREVSHYQDSLVEFILISTQSKIRV